MYLAEPTVNGLVVEISRKKNLSGDHRVHLFHAKQNGMKVFIDDDAVKRIPDGQDMIAEVSGPAASNNMATNSGSEPVTIEIRLYFWIYLIPFKYSQFLLSYYGAHLVAYQQSGTSPTPGPTLGSVLNLESNFTLYQALNQAVERTPNPLLDPLLYVTLVRTSR